MAETGLNETFNVLTLIFFLTVPDEGIELWVWMPTRVNVINALVTDAYKSSLCGNRRIHLFIRETRSENVLLECLGI